MPSLNTAELEAAVSALEAAHSEGKLPSHLQERISVLTSARSSVRNTFDNGSLPPGPPAIPRSPRVPSFRTSDSPGMRGSIETLSLEEEYAAVTEIQRKSGLLREGEKPPPFNQVLRTFTPGMLSAACHFTDPRLVLITTGRSFQDLLSAMNTNSSASCEVDDIFKFSSLQKPFRWGAYIIGKGFQEENLSDGPPPPFEQRLANFNSYKQEAGVNGMDRWKFSHALLREMLEPANPFDQISHVPFLTILDEDPALMGKNVPVVHWRPEEYLRQANFLCWDMENNPSSLCELCPSVGGVLPF